MTQRFTLDAYWGRYGREDFDDTDFAQALDRLPAIGTDGPWIAGGSVRRLVSRQAQDSDFDFFFRDQAQLDAFTEDMKRRGASIVSENDFNITYILPSVKSKPIGEDEFSKAGPDLKVQAIRIAFHDTLEDVLTSFDFSICQCGYDGSDLIFGDWALFDISSKRLVPGKIQYGTSTLRRIIKYTRQGFTICSGGIASLLEQVVADPSIIQQDVEYID